MPDETNTPAKPGTACLGCRRRKLKCSREQEGCSNCLKADLPCVYPVPETGVKRKRGPYKKDKAPRERHLEDLVKYLEPKIGNGDATTGTVLDARAAGDAARSSAFRMDATPTGNSPATTSKTSVAAQPQSGNADDLVRDALIALTRSSVNDRENGGDPNNDAADRPRQTVSLDAGLPGSHPSARRMFEYWDLYLHRVDPLVKIIHCSSFSRHLFAAVDQPKHVSTHIETLLFSVYFCAVTACTAKEVRARFGESRSALLQRYGRTIEANLSDNYSLPALESLQALVLYLIAIRRDNGEVSVRALFSLAVRMAQLLNLHEDPGEKYSPVETQMRRRLWWHICGLESRAAEEGVARQTSIIEDRNVELPSNLNDLDLDPDAKEPPAPRSGVADTSFLVCRFEIVRLAHFLWAIKKRFRLDGRESETEAIQHEQRTAVDDFRARMHRTLLVFCDPSRRFDWLILKFYDAMNVKMHMIVSHPTTQVPTKNMSAAARLDLLQSSVRVIGSTLGGIERAPQLRDWAWYFRGFMQWHAVAVVIAELGRSTNAAFANNAWAVLDPVLGTWDATFAAKRDEPAWEHVNDLIRRAREMRGRAGRRAESRVAAEGDVECPAAPDNLPAEHQQQQQQQQQTTGFQHHTSSAVHPPSAPAPAPTQPTSWPTPPTHPQPPSTGRFLPSAHTPHDLLGFDPNANVNPTPTLDFELADPSTFGGLGDFDALDAIDFSAFDAVFGVDGDGGEGWESSSPDLSLSLSVGGTGEEMGLGWEGR